MPCEQQIPQCEGKQCTHGFLPLCSSKLSQYWTSSKFITWGDLPLNVQSYSILQSHLASSPHATGGHRAPASVTASIQYPVRKTSGESWLLLKGIDVEMLDSAQVPHQHLTCLLMHYKVAQQYTMSILHMQEFNITLCSITYQWKPQGMRNSTLKFSFEYLSSVVLGMFFKTVLTKTMKTCFTKPQISRGQPVFHKTRLSS